MSTRFPANSQLAGNFCPFRDRFANDCPLQRKVNELSVPLTTAPVVRSHDPFAVERPVGRKGSDRQSAASDVRRSGRSRRTGFGLLPPWPQPVGTSSTCCAIARSANSASSPCTCRSERRRRVRVILKARRLAHDDAERERAAVAARAWLLNQIQKRRSAPAAPIEKTAPHHPFGPERLAA